MLNYFYFLFFFFIYKASIMETVNIKSEPGSQEVTIKLESKTEDALDDVPTVTATLTPELNKMLAGIKDEAKVVVVEDVDGDFVKKFKMIGKDCDLKYAQLKPDPPRKGDEWNPSKRKQILHMTHEGRKLRRATKNSILSQTPSQRLGRLPEEKLLEAEKMGVDLKRISMLPANSRWEAALKRANTVKNEVEVETIVFGQEHLPQSIDLVEAKVKDEDVKNHDDDEQQQQTSSVKKKGTKRKTSSSSPAKKVVKKTATTSKPAKNANKNKPKLPKKPKKGKAEIDSLEVSYAANDMMNFIAYKDIQQ